MNNTSAVHTAKGDGSGLSRKIPSKDEGIVWCSAFALASVFIVVENLLTITLFAVNKRLRKKSLFLVINMAFVDLMFGALALPRYINIGFGMDYYLLWKENLHVTLYFFLQIVYTASLGASLISAAFIACERFYAIYRPFKHQTLSVRTYRIAILTVWTVALLCGGLVFVIPGKQFTHVGKPLILLIIICGCNIAIWRKLQHGNAASQQLNRDLQNRRLTKTLLLVSILTLFCWLPFAILIGLRELGVSIPWRYIVIVVFVNYTNPCVNPVVYAFKIPEFRQALALCCFKRREAVNTRNIEIRKNKAAALTTATQLRTLQLKFDEEVLDTKL